MDTQSIIALKRTNRLLITWLAVLTVLLLISLGLNASWAQAAADPPVHVFTTAPEDYGGAHSQKTFIPDLVIDSAGSGNVIVQKTVTLSTLHKHTCLVTASAEVDQLVDAHSLLQFTITKDSLVGVENKEAHRRVEFWPYSDHAPQYEELSTVMAFDGVSGKHTFYFIGRRNTDMYPNAGVSAAGMLIVCFNQVGKWL